MILCGNPKAQYLAHRAEIDAAIRRVLESGHYILGPEVEAFEAEFAAYIGVRHCIGVGSGTDSLQIALRAAGIGAGDEVITTAHTAVATVAAIELAGAIPVFADIESDYFTLNPAAVEGAVSPRTRALIPVHLYGQAADIASFAAIAQRHQLLLIEDCAQAAGARLDGRRVGSFGDFGCFSAYPTKNMGAIGDGGMIVTDDEDLASRCRLVREYGWADRYVSDIPGLNSRLDELQAAVLRAKLTYLDEDNARRRAIAARYDNALTDAPVELPRTRSGAEPVYHQYVVRSDDRDALLSHLRSSGVGALVHYPVPVHRQTAYDGRIRGGESLPETDRAAREVLSLPIYPELRHSEADCVAAAVNSQGWRAARYNRAGR